MARHRHPPANEEIRKLRKEVGHHVMLESQYKGEAMALKAENHRLRTDIVALNHTMKVLAPDIVENLAVILVQLQQGWID